MFKRSDRELIMDMLGVSGKIKNKYPEIPWDEIAKTRDKIIHFYFGVDFSIIWDIATIDIPSLEKKLKAILEQENWNQTST